MTTKGKRLAVGIGLGLLFSIPLVILMPNIREGETSRNVYMSTPQYTANISPRERMSFPYSNINSIVINPVNLFDVLSVIIISLTVGLIFYFAVKKNKQKG
jgi:hypothetical protein